MIHKHPLGKLLTHTMKFLDHIVLPSNALKSDIRVLIEVRKKLDLGEDGRA